MTSPTLPQVSPLAGVNPDTLSELFARDPLGLADQDIETIVTELRRQRAKWREAELAGATKAPRGAKEPKAPASPAIKLTDIGL
jgi:hypothetical protein